MMNSWKKLTFMVCIMLASAMVFSATVSAGGPPLKAKPCGVCHKDFKGILPKDHIDVGAGASQSCLACHKPNPAKDDATKFSTGIHKIHKGEKTKLECSACHDL